MSPGAAPHAATPELCSGGGSSASSGSAGGSRAAAMARQASAPAMLHLTESRLPGASSARLIPSPLADGSPHAAAKIRRARSRSRSKWQLSLFGRTIRLKVRTGAESGAAAS
eukprot:scaffold1963_cov305-Prasinococcus_capsulatus_cf.AAC.2